ncbi:MAG TPA: DUF2339 domain-containing protein [Roseomonas sp.]|jgi:uncharacterized membrane protein
MVFEQLGFLFGLVVAGGWVLGIAGFIKAGRARRLADAAAAELIRLRAEIAALRGGAPAAPRMDPAAEAEPVMPIPEAVPLDPAPPEPVDAPVPVDPAPATAVPMPAPPGRSLEEVLALNWGVWLGAGALLLAGVFLIRYAVEEGWLGPAARTSLAALLGLALVAAGEWLGRRPPRGSLPDHAPAGLTAGGVAVLFGAAYAAASLYALLPPILGFAAMALAGAAGLLLSLRRGQLVAVIGLVGAFVSPMLVETPDPSAFGLFAYLLAVTGAAMAVVRATAWGWLGWCASLFGAAYALGGALNFTTGLEAWAPALFVPLAAALHLALLPREALDVPLGRRLAHLPVIALGLALMPAVLSSPALPAPVGLLLLSPVVLLRARGEARLAWLPAIAAALGLVVLHLWAVADWSATAEAVIAGGTVQAVIPGALAPDALHPYLGVALALALLHLLAGLWLEARAPRGLRFAALAAAVPVLALAIAYGRVRGFAVDQGWAAVALLLAGILTAAAARAARQVAPLRAGAHAAGATAALALMAAMLLRDHWLSLAVSLLLPPLAVIAGRSGLRALRGIALAVAAVVLMRLVLNESVLGYGFGSAPILNALWFAYGVPALAFWMAAMIFRRDGGEDAAVSVLEAGAVALTTALVLLQIRHGLQGGALDGPDWPFLEAALQLSALALLAAATLLLARHGHRALGWAWRVLGTMAMALGAWLLLINPWLAPAAVGATPIANALLPAYLLPGLLAGIAAVWPRETAALPLLRRLLGLYALAAVFAFITLSVRHAFRGSLLAEGSAEEAELYSYSGAWILFGAALVWGGIRARSSILRQAGLLLIALATLKVFLLDMDALVGLWRVLSFLGLGLALIGLGAVYRRFVVRRDPGEGAALPAAGPSGPQAS